VLAKRSGDRSILLSADPDRGGVLITVRDNGVGILPELRDRIFEPFFTTKRARGGTGLGLSISKSIIDSFGGAITVESQPGEGASFRIWLPADTEPSL
jgi:signal transduction histidine kinase